MTNTTTLEPRGDTRAPGPSDADLLDRVRSGDSDAYGLLYERHEPAARSLARYLTTSSHDADDVVADAFARVLRAIKGGAGPTEAFRPYLLTAVRRTVWRRSEDRRRHRLAADEDEEEFFDLRLSVEPEDRTDEAIVLRAFAELPERWQLVLWHTEIEGQPPAAVAPLLGLSPNATAALAVRAREGLRQAYLQAHLQARPSDDCRFTVEHLGAYVRDGLGQRDTAKVEEHLEDCEDCGRLQSDLGSLNKVLRGVVGPAVLGAGAARYLAGRGGDAAGAATSTTMRDIARRVRFPQAVGLAGVAALLLVTLGLRTDVARPTPSAVPTAAVLDRPVEPVSSQLVDVALAGTGGGVASVSGEPCEGATLPLSLPAGSTPVDAKLVAGAPSGEPTVLAPEDAAGLEPVGTDTTATLVGDDGACVSSMIAPLADAPDDTALAVSFLDQLGRLHVLLVPQIVAVVQDALQAATDLAASVQLPPALLAYLTSLQDALDQLPGGGGSGSTTDLAGVPDVDIPDLPALDPATGGGTGGGGSGDDLVDDVTGVIDDVTGVIDDTTDDLPPLPGLPSLPGL
jgi:RNA polymerase sigma factor (sigma-70 family)